MGDALIDVWFSLLGLSYSLAHTYKVLKKLFFHALWTLTLLVFLGYSQGSQVKVKVKLQVFKT